MILLGLAGRIGSGKTTVAIELVTNHEFTRQRFAGPLKDMLRTLGMTDEELDGALKEAPCDLLGGKTPRWAQQSLGTEWGRNMIDPDIWVNAWRQRITSNRVVADDVRFPNEVAMIHHLGGKVIMIERPMTDPTNPSPVHASEQFNFKADAIVFNDGTVKQLFERVGAAMLKLSLDDGVEALSNG